MINLGFDEVRREVKIGEALIKYVHLELVKILHEYVNVFAWSYQDMHGVDTNIVEHRFCSSPNVFQSNRSFAEPNPT